MSLHVWVVEEFDAGRWRIARTSIEREDARFHAANMRALGRKVRVRKYVPNSE